MMNLSSKRLAFRAVLCLVVGAAVSNCATPTPERASNPSPPAAAPDVEPAPRAPVETGAPGAPVQTGAPKAPVVQPGAPGEESSDYQVDDPSEMGGLAHTEADVAFMRGMIPHHAQALEMTALVPDRAVSDGFDQLALRMEISQRDEIALMERWLSNRSESGGGDHTMHSGAGGMMMPGMLTPDQMAQLMASTGLEFERLFLEFMIQHHEGAIVMVTDLFGTAGAGQESEIFQFASHVDADQRMEIARMRQMLETRR